MPAKRASTVEPRLTDLDDARAFCRVVDLGSITRAAAALGEAKGSVSKRLARLERTLGVELFRRGNGRVRPTEEGITFRMHLGTALGLLDEATQQLHHAHESPRGRLRITAPQDIATALLGPLLAEFVAAEPELGVDIIVTERLLDLHHEDIDVALRASMRLDDSTLIARKLLDLDIGLFASPDYLAGGPALGKVEDVLRHRVVSPFRSPETRLVRFEHRSQPRLSKTVELSPRIWSNDGAFAREVALAGGGITLLPCLLVRADVGRRTLVRVLPEYSVLGTAGLYLVHRPGRFLARKVQVFRDFLVARLRG